MNDIYLLLCLPIFGIIGFKWTEIKRMAFLFRYDISKQTSIDQVVIHMHIIEDMLLSKKKSPETMILIEAMITNHIKYCSNPNCLCIKLSKIVIGMSASFGQNNAIALKNASTF